MKKLLDFIFPFGSRRRERAKRKLAKKFMKDYLYSYYDKESLAEKRFYNIGPGSHRSQYDFWSYIELKSDSYPQKGIDIFYDLESLEPLPMEANHAEIIFNSFVIEHISTEATKNLCREAFRVLKPGGVFHSKVHCYEYAFRLFNKGVFPSHIPFGCRESSTLIDKFIVKHRGRVQTFFKAGRYTIQSLTTPSEQISFSAGDAFLYHNVTAAIKTLKNQAQSSDEILDTLRKKHTLPDFYKNLKQYVNVDEIESHQHNADYFPKEELFAYIKNLGFSEVYFTQPFQSISPALWESPFNNIYGGFLFSIEAVK